MVYQRLIILCLLPMALAAETLDLCAIKRIAIDKNPAKRAALEGLSVAFADVGYARSPYFPTLDFLADYSRWQRHLFFPKIFNIPNFTFIPTILGPFNDYLFSFSSQFIIFDSGQRRGNLLTALSNRYVAKEEVDRVQQEILLNATLAYFDLLANLKLKDVAAEMLDRAQDHLETSEKRYDVGDIPLSDVLRSKVALWNSKLDVVKAENAIRTSKGNLNVTIGLSPDTLIEIERTDVHIEDPEEINVSQAQCLALQQRPEILAEFGRIDSAWYQVEVAKSGFGPKIVARGSIGKQDSVFPPRDTEWLVGVSLQQSLFSGYSTVYATRRANHQYRQEIARLDQIALGVEQEVWNAHSNLREAYETIQLAEVQAEDAKESLRLAEERFKVGANTIDDLLDAQTSYTRAKVNLVSSEWRYASAYARFQWAQGEI